MHGVSRWTLALLVLVSATGCSESPSQELAQEALRPSASTIFADLKREHAAGQPQAALQHARSLTTEHAGTIEADSASKLIPTLEAAVEAEAKAERARVAKAAKEAESRRLADNWTYRSNVDPMTSKASRSAMIRSENTVDFDFPYSGPQHGTLHIRNHPSHGRDVILSIERGQFLCQSYDDCQIRVRFDEGSPERWNAVGASDNSSTVIFLRNEGRFLQRMRSAKTVRIQAPIYQEGQPIFEFHVGGFDHGRYTSGS